MIVLAAYDRNGKMLQARCEDVLSDTQIESQKRIRMENPDGEYCGNPRVSHFLCGRAASSLQAGKRQLKPAGDIG